MAAAKSGGLWGYIALDKDGYYWAIPPEYEEADQFQNGGEIVKRHGKYRLITKQGNWLIPDGRKDPCQAI